VVHARNFLPTQTFEYLKFLKINQQLVSITMPIIYLELLKTLTDIRMTIWKMVAE
jgi:hypothetical protein